METSQVLAIESFSHSWLANRKPSSFDNSPTEPLRNSLDLPHENMMITMPKIIPEESSQYASFDFPISKSPAALVHADETFSGGHILPKYGNQSNSSVIPVLIHSTASRPVCDNDRVLRYRILKGWGKSSQRILRKYLGYLRPFCSSSRRSIRVDDIDGKVWEPNSVENWCDFEFNGRETCDIDMGIQKFRSSSNSPEASPQRSSPNYFTDDSSICEAILHCKRSFES